MQLIKIDRILPTEEFSIKEARILMKRMIKEGVWRKPICLEKNHLIIMDGHHRFAAAKYLGLKFVPCELYSYEDVKVGRWREDYEVTPRCIIERGLAGDLYPYKTTDHTFPGGHPVANISLKELYKKDGE